MRELGTPNWLKYRQICSMRARSASRCLLPRWMKGNKHKLIPQPHQGKVRKDDLRMTRYEDSKSKRAAQHHRNIQSILVLWLLRISTRSPGSIESPVRMSLTPPTFSRSHPPKDSQVFATKPSQRRSNCLDVVPGTSSNAAATGSMKNSQKQKALRRRARRMVRPTWWRSGAAVMVLLSLLELVSEARAGPLASAGPCMVMIITRTSCCLR